MLSHEFIRKQDIHDDLEGQMALDYFIDELEYNGFKKVEDNCLIPPMITKTLRKNTSIELTINTM